MNAGRLALIFLFSVLAFPLILFIPYPVEAQQATNYDFTLNGQRNQCDIMKGILDVDGVQQHIYGCIPNEANSDKHTFSWFRSNINPTVVNTITIYPQQAGCDPINNPCNADGGSASGNTLDRTGQSGKLGGIWCGITDCFTLWISATSHSHQLLRITPSLNDVTGYLNITSSREIRPMLTGIDFNTGGFGGINVYYVRCEVAGACAVSNEAELVKVGGTSIMGQVATAHISMFFKGSQSATQGWGIVDIDICWFCDGNTANNVNNKLVIVSSRQAVNTNRAIDVIRGDLMTFLCGVTNSGGGFSSTQNTGTVRFLNGSKWLYGTDANIYTLQRTTCAKDNTQTYATLGISNYISSIKTNTLQTETDSDPTMHSYGGIYWVQHGNASSLSSLTQVNATSLNTNVNFDAITGSTISGYVGTNPPFALALDPISHTLLRTGTDSKAQIIYLNNFVAGAGGGGGGAQICFIIQGTQQEICFETDENGNPIVGSTAELVTNMNPPTLAVGKFLCQMGIIEDCTDGAPTDPSAETNGVGWILFIILLAVLMALIGSALYGRVKIEYNLIIQIVILMTASGLAVALNWIPDMVFYAIIFIIIGFASIAGTKFVLGQVRGRAQTAE